MSGDQRGCQPTTTGIYQQWWHGSVPNTTNKLVAVYNPTSQPFCSWCEQPGLQVLTHRNTTNKNIWHMQHQQLLSDIWPIKKNQRTPMTLAKLSNWLRNKPVAKHKNNKEGKKNKKKYNQPPTKATTKKTNDKDPTQQPTTNNNHLYCCYDHRSQPPGGRQPEMVAIGNGFHAIPSDSGDSIRFHQMIPDSIKLIKTTVTINKLFTLLAFQFHDWNASPLEGRAFGQPLQRNCQHI